MYICTQDWSKICTYVHTTEVNMYISTQDWNKICTYVHKTEVNYVHMYTKTEVKYVHMYNHVLKPCDIRI